MKRIVVIAFTLCLLQGCKSKEASQASSTPVVTKQAAPLDPATLGDVSGTIHFTGKAPVPVKIDTTMDPACAMSGSSDFSSEQYIVKDARLANVYLYVKSGPPEAMSASATGTAPVVLDQKGCRYTPHVVAIMHGGSVSFQNSDAIMHNIHTMPTIVGNEAIDISQGPKGPPVVRMFTDAEVMMPVRCNNHPWMNAFINISPTPFFSISNADGHFDLRGLPAGEYVLGAVHEKLGEQTLKITVPAKSSAKADFTFAMK